MENSNMDRWLGVFFTLVLVIGEIFGIIVIPGIFGKILLSLWILALGKWAWSGKKTIPIGWKGLLTFLGQRLNLCFGEGLHWAPWPFGIKTADCRQTSRAIDPLTVLTSDNIGVEIKGTIIYQIDNLILYFDVDEGSIKQGVDDIWDEVIRTQVVGKPFDDVKKMHVEVSEEAKTALENHATVLWGIKIIKVPVTIKASSQEVVADLELQARELMQQKGQLVETELFAKIMSILMDPKGPNLPQEKAYDHAQLITSKATKTMDAKTIAIDPTTVTLIATLLGGKKL